MRHIFDPIVIPDSDLATFLEGKLLEKPDYGYPTERSDYERLSREATQRINPDRNRAAKKRR